MKLKSFLTVGIACAAIAGIAGSLAGPAAADPPSSPNSVSLAGSDTIQDVMDQFGTDAGGSPQTVGSWDAFKPGTGTATVPLVTHDLISPKSTTACTNISRPNGSGDGVNSLRRALSGTTAVSGTVSVAPTLSHLTTDSVNPPVSTPLGSQCWNVARSSSGPGANQDNAGLLTYVPFALDAVALATGPATAVTGSDPAVATKITHADSFTLGTLTTPGDLIKLYRDCAPVTDGGVTYTPDGTVTNATNQPIHLYVPQAGSGTRSFWASTLGFNATTLPTCVHDTSETTGAAVEEHDGTTFAADADGVGPFSIAQWIAQFNGHNDRRHHAAIHNLNGTAPTTSPGPLLNTAFPIKREVYNVIPTSQVASGALHNLFVGSSSLLCSDSATITNYGFAQLTGSPLGHACGATSNDLRAYTTSGAKQL